MSRKKKLINNTNIPEYAIERFARCVFPDIQAFYASEEGQREFAEWQAEQAAKKAALQRQPKKARAADNSAALVVIAVSSFLLGLVAWIRGVSSSHLQNRFGHIL